MLIGFPKSKKKKMSEGDLIALTKNGRFVGFATVKVELEDRLLVEVDKAAERTFNELYGENISFSLEIDWVYIIMRIILESLIWVCGVIS